MSPALDSVCIAGLEDTDADGLGDACELAVARAFAPQLEVSARGCNWDTSVVPARLGGEYLFAVQPGSNGDTIRIAYLPAYYRDCGWSGIKCWLPFVDCAPHIGDSEALFIDVRRNGGHWHVIGVFLSAHCFGRSDGDCRWYRDEELGAFRWVRGAPVVWVAEGRQANYPSRAACDRGHSRIDTCDRNRWRYRFPVDSQRRNVGSPQRPMGCVTAAELGSRSRMPVASARECIRDDARFRGWQARGAGATGYGRYLREVAGW